MVPLSSPWESLPCHTQKTVTYLFITCQNVYLGDLTTPPVNSALMSPQQE